MNKAYIVCGAPGAGKTTHARHLALDRRALLLDIDNVTERLVRIGLAQAGRCEDDRDSEYFKRTYREPIYETLFDIAGENLPVLDVVVVGPFTRELEQADWPLVLSRRLGCPVEVHYVHCPPGLRRKRIEARGNARDDAKLGDWNEYVQYYGDEHPPAFDHVSVKGY